MAVVIIGACGSASTRLEYVLTSGSRLAGDEWH